MLVRPYALGILFGRVFVRVTLTHVSRDRDRLRKVLDVALEFGQQLDRANARLRAQRLDPALSQPSFGYLGRHVEQRLACTVFDGKAISLDRAHGGGVGTHG